MYDYGYRRKSGLGYTDCHDHVEEALEDALYRREGLCGDGMPMLACGNPNIDKLIAEKVKEQTRTNVQQPL